MQNLWLSLVLLATAGTMSAQTGVQYALLPFGIWPVCENLVPSGLPLAPVPPEMCAGFTPGNETFVLSMKTQNPRTVAFLYSATFVGPNGPETLTGVVQRDTAHPGWTNSTPLAIGRANADTVKVSIEELVPLLVRTESSERPGE